MTRHEVDRTLYWKSGHYSAIPPWGLKLQRSGNPQKIWLFNLATDPTEQTNLANVSEFSSILKTLTADLLFQESQQAEPIWKSVSESPIAIDYTTDMPSLLKMTLSTGRISSRISQRDGVACDQ